jgi:hypothetical protein
VARRVGLLALAVLLAAGCGVRNDKAFTAQKSAGCFTSHGFTQVTTDPNKVGFVAGFAENGGLRATSPTGNVVTIAFAADASSVGGTEDAFRTHAPPKLRPHLPDIMSADRNAVLVWTVTPTPGELDTAQRCLAS